MNRLIKYYNQNRYMIWLVVLILIAIIALIQILNNFTLERKNAQNNQNTIIANNINKNYSVITGKEIKEEVSNIIDQFLNYCNNQEVEKAYEILSDECKEVLYPTLEGFTKNYYNKLFNKKKTYFYQGWITNNGNYTYKIDFTEDMLATGTAAQTSIVDYYTVIKDNDNYKLNINKFIGITDINKTEKRDDIIINIKRKRVYMDYETYEIEVKNNSKGEIILDSLQDTDTVYIEDDKEQKYYWTSHEIIEDDISIRNAQSKEIEIKFNKSYQPKNEIIKIVFSDIILENKTLKVESFL
ncbi:MAG: hypothetical protein J6A29_01855 [Clostridia bacterium]|nr:hypothetical protein [Clostridia bacterium]